MILKVFKLRSHEQGSVLTIILVAVALFAALMYTFTRTANQGTSDTSTHGKNILAVSEIMDYAKDIERAIDRAISGGCSESELSFDNPLAAGYVNADSPVDKSCHIFNAAGGGITWQSLSGDINDGSEGLFQAEAQIQDIGETNFDSQSVDLTLLFFGLKKSACEQINKNLGYNLTSVPINDGSYVSAVKFTGSFAYTEDINGLAAAPNPSPCPGGLCGRSSGCFQEESVGQRYVFYHTLLAR